jgi:hypothetical protein
VRSQIVLSFVTPRDAIQSSMFYRYLHYANPENRTPKWKKAFLSCVNVMDKQRKLAYKNTKVGATGWC